MSEFRLTFAVSGADQIYRLSADGEMRPEIPATGPQRSSTELDEVLVLPASEGLPFRLEIPFSDPEKIRRILPQLVGDRFARVTSDWLFAWRVQAPTEGPISVVGLAFPPSALRPAPVGSGGWRLVIPDLFLAPEGKPGCRTVVAPSSRGAVEFDASGMVVRYFVDGRGVPAPAASSTYSPFDPVREGAAVFAACSAALAGSDGSDLSGWHQARRQRLFKGAAIGGFAVFLSLTVIWHIFLLWDCTRLEERRRQLTQILARSFERVFPGQRSVEPVLQARRLLEEREREAEKRAPEPSIALTEFLGEALTISGQRFRLEKLSAHSGGWRLQGIIGSYRELSSLTADLAGTVSMRHGQPRETSPIKPDGRTVSGLRFILEGPWKR